MGATDLSVVIPTFNGRALLADCLPALHAAVERCARPVEIIVVDDGSTDDTRDWLTREFPGVRIVAMERNAGFAAGANAGIRAAAGEWVALLNNDVTVEPDWIAAALAEPVPGNVAAVATLILRAEAPDILDSAGVDYAPCGVAVPVGADQPPETLSPRQQCFCPSAAAGFYRRAALDRVGLFRESFGAYYEDVDLGVRLNLAGFACRFEPRARSRHIGSATYGRRSRQMLICSTRNRAWVFWGRMPAGLIARHLPARIVAGLAQLCAAAVNGEFIARTVGATAALLNVGEIMRMRRETRRIRTVGTREFSRRLMRPWLGPLLRRRGARRG